jgi:hypothetical protein
MKAFLIIIYMKFILITVVIILINLLNFVSCLADLCSFHYNPYCGKLSVL